MRTRLIAIGLGAALIAPHVSARTQFEALQSDVDKLQAIVDESWADEEAERMDSAAQLTDMIPPDDGTGSALVIPESKYVTVRERETTVELTDVPRQAWFAPYVRELTLRGIASGYRNPEGTLTGIFGAADSVSIAQLAKMALRAAGLSEAACPPEVLHTQALGDWSQPYIACAEYLSWTVFADPELDIHRPATRAEVVATMLDAFDIPTIDAVIAGTFTDVAAETPYSAAVEKAASLGIINGYTDAEGKRTGLFGPENNINRAEIAKILVGAMHKLRS